VAFGEQKMGRTQVFKWFSKLKSGVTTAEDDQDVKCKSTSRRDENVDYVKELLFESEQSLSLMLLTGWLFQLDQFRAF
jgi:hypothetical protein